MEERRGQDLTQPYKCKFCKFVSVGLSVYLTDFTAKVKSLFYLDTRIMSLCSGLINLSWVLFVFAPFVVNSVYPIGFLSRIVFGAPYEYVIPLLMVLCWLEVCGAMLNHFRMRFIGSIVSTFWWAWLAAMASIEPANESAVSLFGVLAIFRAWTFITINYTHPEGKLYGRTRIRSTSR